MAYNGFLDGILINCLDSFLREFGRGMAVESGVLAVGLGAGFREIEDLDAGLGLAGEVAILGHFVFESTHE